MERIILHCDCNSFFASCEELIDPSLKTVPMAVTGDPENRHGIILAKNRLAKEYDIKTAETIWQAKQKCPGLVCVLAHHGLYGEVSEKINTVYLEYTDLVEPASIDESYLDVTNSIHLFGLTPAELADVLRTRIKHEVGVTISVGVSFCKTVAKFGSDYKKPDATTVIMRDDLPEIYWKAPVEDMLMAGRKTAEKLRSFGIGTIGDLAKSDKAMLEKYFGKAGVSLYEAANGLENDPVRPYYEEREVKSIGNSMTFRRDIKGEGEIRSGIAALSDSVARRLRKHGKKCTVVQIGIKTPDFRTIQRQCTLERATDLQKVITETAFALVKKCWDMSSPIRLLSVTAAGLIEADEDFFQYTLFDAGDAKNDRQSKIEGTLDEIRRKYGNSAIRFGHFKDDETGIDQ